MKKKTFLISIILISTFLSFAQLNWEKHESNPVMQVQSGTWYAWNVMWPVVIHEDGIFKMWFCGNNSSSGRHIGYASSDDGIEWEILDDPVISSGEPGSWALRLYPGSVLLINDTLRMWFCGTDNNNENSAFGYAWSVVEHEWNIHPEPVLEPGAPGAWDDVMIFSPSVYYDGTIYYMYYTGAGDDFEIGYATSFNGINWEKDYANSPIIQPGPPGSFYDAGVFDGHPIMYNDTIRLFFSGSDGTSTYPPYDSYWRVGYAWSTDNTNWNIHPDPIVDVGDPGEWDETTVAGSSVLIHNGELKMWYFGVSYNSFAEIGYACGDNAIIRVPAQQPTIQAGIDAACDGSIVLVDEGIYYENINFMGKAITVASQFIIDGEESHIENTIIDGSQPAIPNNASVVYFNSGEDTTSVICGFTIQNGTGTYPDNWGDLSGGGILVENSSAKIIHNRIMNNTLTTTTARAFGAGISTTSINNDFNIISDNLIANNEISTSSSYFGAGAGICLFGEHKVHNNIIESNHVSGKWARGAGIFTDNSLMTENSIGIIDGNQIINNTADVTAIVGFGCGIYLYNMNSGYTISNNIISENIYTGIDPYGAAIGIINWTDNGDYYIEGNIIENNEADRGGAICITSWPSGFYIKNNLFNANIASNRAGAIYLYNSTNEDLIQNNPGRLPKTGSVITTKQTLNEIPHIMNNTFYGNLGSNWGGAIFNEFVATNTVLTNNIFLSNDANIGQEIYTSYSSNACQLYYNRIDTSMIFGNWVGENNMDADPLFEDTGNDDFYLLAGSPCIDAGDPTYPYDPDNTIVDMGAFYFNHDLIVALEATEITNTSFQANWEEAESAIGYLLDVALDENFTLMVEGYTNLDVGNVLSFVVDELTPLTSYFYRIRVNYYMGRSGYSNTITASTITSIENLSMNQDINLKIIPNPISSTTSLTYLINQKSPVFLDIYSINGKHILQILNKVQEEGEYKIVFDSSDLPNGVYFITLKTNKGIHTKKIIKL